MGSIAIAAVHPLPARAADLFASAEQAREFCAQSSDWCAGFVAGALDGWAALEAYYEGEKFCLPADLTTGRIATMFKQRLDLVADRREEPAAYILFEALIAEFPCGTPLPG